MKVKKRLLTITLGIMICASSIYITKDNNLGANLSMDELSMIAYAQDNENQVFSGYKSSYTYKNVRKVDCTLSQSAKVGKRNITYYGKVCVGKGEGNVDCEPYNHVSLGPCVAN